jgi:hypothetical protein
VLYADAELFHLALASPGIKKVCAVLCRTQLLTYAQTGHCLTFRPPQIYTYIANERRNKDLWKQVIVCVRCQAQALAYQWVEAVDLTQEGRSYVLTEHPSEFEIDQDYLRPCTGDAAARGLCDFLDIALFS